MGPYVCEKMYSGIEKMMCTVNLFFRSLNNFGQDVHDARGIGSLARYGHAPKPAIAPTRNFDYI
jgi:hypothetical protein